MNLDVIDDALEIRFREEISKIPMYADSIMRMLRDIRKTVNAAAKLPGSSAFTQFLKEVRRRDHVYPLRSSLFFIRCFSSLFRIPLKLFLEPKQGGGKSEIL